MFLPEKSEWLAFVLYLFSLGVALLFTVPFVGVLVRYRANYNPKALQLDAEGDAVPRTGPVVNSYCAMFARVWRLEGARGLYKGLMPTALVSCIATIAVLILMDKSKLQHGSYNMPNAKLPIAFAYSLGMVVVSLPITIITYRSITTPHKLGYFDLKKSLRTILTGTERKKPWILYLTPGLLASEILQLIVAILFLGLFRQLLLPVGGILKLDRNDVVSVWKAVVYLVIVVLTTLVLAPLEVITTRLSIQRNHAPGAYESISQEAEGNGEEAAEHSGTDEDVIGHEGDPYSSLINCAKRIINEEGIMTLYRAWWFTLLGGLATGFA